MCFYDFVLAYSYKTNIREKITKKNMYAHTEAGGLCEVEAVLRQSRRRGQGRVIDGHLRGRLAPTGLAFQLKTIIFHL